MVTMVTKTRDKTRDEIHCKYCDYKCRDKYNMTRHLSSTKHQMVTNGNKTRDETRHCIYGNKNQSKDFFCQCGKAYKFRSGLSRHQKKCLKTNVVVEPQNNNNSSGSEIMELCKTMKTLVEDNRLKTELMSKMLNQNSLLIPKVGNNNNKISINVFLNEKCKGAMNLQNFVDNVKVTLEDLKYTQNNGYVKGISNIFVKHLTDMEPTERPIHCSDKKRLQFYVKDENTWTKDSEHTKINKSIQVVTMKQIKQLKEWEQKHPDYLTNDGLLGLWHQMIQKIMGGSNEQEREKNTEDIKKGISSSIDMKKAMT